MCRSQMDLAHIPFPDGTFDAIICNHVLEHIVDDLKAMAELHRVLKPGGWSILQVPISLSLRTTYEDFSIATPKEREEAFGQNDHVRIYGQDYVSRLERAGFKVNVFDWWTEAAGFGGPSNLYGLNQRERTLFRSEAELEPLTTAVMERGQSSLCGVKCSVLGNTWELRHSYWSFATRKAAEGIGSAALLNSAVPVNDRASPCPLGWRNRVHSNA